MSIKYKFIGLIIIILVILSGRASCLSKKDKSNKGSSGNISFVISAPSNLTGTAISLSQITISWTDNANNENGFEIYRAPDNINYISIGTVNANIISYADITQFSPFINYYYRINAFNNIGDRSDYSNIVIINLNPFQPIWSKIACRQYHGFAVTNEGILWGWGDNEYGQLGLGDTNNRYFPAQIREDFFTKAFEGITAVATSRYHNLALKTNATLWAWGTNTFGQLGTGDTINTYYPYPIGTDSDWFAIATGMDDYSLACKTNGTLYSWGRNQVGQLGLGDFGLTKSRNTPTQIGTDSDWVEIKGCFYSLGRKNNGTIYSWGWNSNGQLGLGDSGDDTFRITPTQIGNDSDWVEIAAGIWSSMGRKNNGAIYSWGTSEYLGIGDSIDRFTPTQIGTDSDWDDIITYGESHLFARKTNGTIYSWGSNERGQLGLGDSGYDKSRNTPTQVSTDSGWGNVSGGNEHSLGLKTNGTIWSWGLNIYGQLGLGDTLDRNTPTQIGQ